jgi:hypothetical protein
MHVCEGRHSGEVGDFQVAFDATPGGDPRGPWCKACRQPISPDQPAETVRFETAETNDMSGLYHKICAKPFASLARVINLKPFG